MLTHKFYYSQFFSRQFVAVISMMKLLNSTSHLKSQLKILIREINKTLNVEHTVFYVYKRMEKEIWGRFLLNGELKQIEKPIRNGKGIIQLVLQKGKIVKVEDATTLKNIELEISKIADTPVRSLLMVPIASRNGDILGGIQVINKKNNTFDNDDIRYLMIIANMVPYILQKNSLYNNARQAKKLEQDINRAVQIQKSLLPKQSPQIPGYEIFSYNKSSEKVGGDYYDFFPFSRKLSFTVADVAGKGVSAALLTANLHAFLHAYTSENESTRDIVNKLNNHLYLYTNSDIFVTCFMANLNYNTHKLKYINAGHIPPILIRTDKKVESLQKGGVPIGMIDSYTYQEAEVDLRAGDLLVIFSDGISDAMNQKKETFGLERVKKLALKYAHLPVKEMGEKLLKEIKQYARLSKSGDDQTLVIIKRKREHAQKSLTARHPSTFPAVRGAA